MGKYRRRIDVRSDRLLLVEGRDEVNLCEALVVYCFTKKPDLQVIDAGGKDTFDRNLEAIRESARTRSDLEAIGVIRDADCDATAAFDSVCGSLSRLGYKPPANHSDVSDGVPAIGVFIVPDGVAPGAIETLCRRAQGGDQTAACVDEYLRCLAERSAMRSKNADKSFAHAYLAAMKNPVARVGEGALQGVWNFASPAFAELAGFLRRLAGQQPT